MPKWLKVVLAVGGAMFLLCGLGVGGFAWWLNANKDMLKNKGEAVMKDARDFATHSDSAGCVTETLARLKEKHGFTDEIGHRVFLGECLRNAPRSAGFCDGVPKQTDFMQAALWANLRCQPFEGPQEPCTRMMQEVEIFCEKHP